MITDSIYTREEVVHLSGQPYTVEYVLTPCNQNPVTVMGEQLGMLVQYALEGGADVFSWCDIRVTVTPANLREIAPELAEILAGRCTCQGVSIEGWEEFQSNGMATHMGVTAVNQHKNRMARATAVLADYFLRAERG